MSRWRLLLAVLSLSMSTPLARAASLETLLMPGPVIAGHAKYEQECSRCHDRADRSRQAALCRTCHEPIAADIAQHKGFHGRLAGAETAQCGACHSEHKGRKADIVKLESTSFPHARTDFPLLGAHASVACADCHAAGRKQREAPSACVDCHGKEDPHAGKLGRNCADCHEAAGWARVRFDHAKTKFALTGKHVQATCAACHAGNRYTGTPTQCAACHAPDDVHAGARGAACADCHQTTGWTGTKYDHLRATGFALAGAHASLDCKSCHKTANLKDPLPRECAGCHRSDDPHATRFGAACESCHAASAWTPTSFDHTRDGKFELRGAHQKLDCHACHTAVVASQQLGTRMCRMPSGATTCMPASWARTARNAMASRRGAVTSSSITTSRRFRSWACTSPCRASRAIAPRRSRKRRRRASTATRRTIVTRDRSVVTARPAIPRTAGTCGSSITASRRNSP